jgi:hypothetical protein
VTLEFKQLEIGISIKRYFAPTGTAGFDRCSVKGYKRDPAPPPNIKATIFTVFSTPGIFLPIEVVEFKTFKFVLVIVAFPKY